MGYWVKAVLGLGLFLAGLAAFEYALYEVMQIGTCATGGPYVSARECPEGTTEKVLLFPAGLILGTVGILVFAFRGKRPGAPEGGRRVSAILLGWCSIFVVTGVVALIASYGPGSDPDQPARWVGIFLAALFIPMGLAAIWAARLGRRTRQWATSLPQRATATPAGARPPQPGPSSPRAAPVTPSPPTAGGDPVDRLRRLGELRDKGMLSPAEFESAKRRILADL